MSNRRGIGSTPWSEEPWTRRSFLGAAGAGAAYLWSQLTFGAGRALAQPASRIVDRQPWATLEELAEGVWAVVSMPLESDDWTTGCNGGLIAGRERVVAIEGFLRPAGAEWLGQQAVKLTGRQLTDIVVTHFHRDHVDGLEGYAAADTPTLRATPTTLTLIRQEDEKRDQPTSAARQKMLDSFTPITPQEPSTLDLGGRTLTLHPRRGHTPSDVTAELDDPSIVFAGDLVWNGLFPNYRDTAASAFTRSIRALRRRQATTYVSGHGALANGADVDALLMLVESVGEAARRAHEKGLTYAEGAAAFSLPRSMADWVLFNPRYFEVAFEKWYEELGSS
jgi:glyoxylase-like metal-dependent hydrolase (beta-lactamase superfamily II)